MRNSPFTVEGQVLAARSEIKKERICDKAAVVVEVIQVVSGRLYYEYGFARLDECPKVGDQAPAAPGWTATVKATVFPWEV